MSRTLNLDEAAKYLQLHKETLRQKVRNDEIPAAKIGKRWVFIEEDLEILVRSHYADKWRAIQGKNLKETKLCPCIEEVTRARIGSTSQFPEDEEYENLLAPK